MTRSRIPTALALALLAAAARPAVADEARLLRYPHVHGDRVAFCYLGDIWTAGLDGKDPHRLTANRARDLFPRFSPDGQWIAFSSDRDGNLDVWVIPSDGGNARQLTYHSADDAVLGWSPDGKTILFASNRGEDFLGTLYTVPLDGGAETRAGPDFGVYGTYSPDGKKLAVNRKGQPYWRKGYRGAYNTDVTVMDLSDKSFTDLTDHPGMDTWPLWAGDGFIYFVSDRDPKAQANLWKVPEGGGEPVRVTDFTDGDLRWPALNADGKTIVFERDFRLWKLDTATEKAEPVPVAIAAEAQEAPTEFRTVDSEADDSDAAPDGKHVVVSVRGELFVVPTGENGELAQLTKGAARDREVAYSPDGKHVAFVSDQDGREELYVAPADGLAPPKRITDLDTLKTSFLWSPDGKALAFTTSDGKLYRVAAEGGEAKELAASKFGTIARPAWSPDGSWIALALPDATRTTDIVLVPAEGGAPRKVTFDSAPETNPRFSADAKKLYFQRIEGGFEAGGERPQVALMVVLLEKQTKDPSEAAEDAEESGPDAAMRRLAEGRRNAARREPPKAPEIDWDGLKRRTRPVLSRAPGTITAYVPAHDGKTLVFVASEGTGRGGTPTLYSCTDDGKNVRRIVAGNAPAEGQDEDRGRGPRGFGGLADLKITNDGRTVFFREGRSVYSASLGSGPNLAAAAGGDGPSAGPPGGGRFGAAAGGGGGGGSRRKINFRVTLAIDRPAEWAQMFGDAWRTMKYRFYDEHLHGVDWDAARAKYEPAVAHVADRHELMNLLNEMIGELNASHTGAAAGRDGEPRGVQTVHLGLDLEPDADSGLYKVTHVYEDGPADKDWVRVAPGHYLLAIDGAPVKAGDNLWKVLTDRRLNKKVKLTLNDKPCDEGAWTVRYEPISTGAFAQLRYDRWVKERKDRVEERSGGRVGYLHIKAMDQTSLRKFEKDLRENRTKEALIIDQRFNGGGNIEQELLAILVQRPYQVWQPRGTEPTDRPFRGFFGPKVVLQNWRSASNAEMFPAGFRALGLGKLIGTPTMGAVIGTGSYRLIDGSTVRTPGVGVYLADPDRTNMENSGVRPDILVENTPEDNLSGHDRQLEAAVAELLRQLGETPKAEAAAGGQ